jgi:hypothetical protein
VGDAVEELIGGEVMHPLPDQVGQRDQEQQCNSGGAASCRDNPALGG